MATAAARVPGTTGQLLLAVLPIGLAILVVDVAFALRRAPTRLPGQLQADPSVPQAIALTVLLMLNAFAILVAYRTTLPEPERSGTAVALAVGVALAAAVGTVSASTSTSVEQSVNANLTGDLLVTGESGADPTPTLDSQALTQVRLLRAVDLVATGAGETVRINGRTVFAMAYDDHNAANLMLGRRPVAGSIEAPAPGEVVLDQTDADQLHLHVGDRFTIDLAGGSGQYTIKGIYAVGQLQDVVILPWSDPVADFQARQPTEALIRLAPGSSRSAATADVDRLFPAGSRLTVRTRDETAGAITAAFDGPLNMLPALLAVAPIIAALGVIGRLTRCAPARSMPELSAPSRSDAVLASQVGGVLGIVAGIGVGAGIVRALHDRGVTELTVPWSHFFWYLAAAALLAMVTASAPALRATRLDLPPAIDVPAA